MLSLSLRLSPTQTQCVAGVRSLLLFSLLLLFSFHDVAVCGLESQQRHGLALQWFGGEGPGAGSERPGLCTRPVRTPHIDLASCSPACPAIMQNQVHEPFPKCINGNEADELRYNNLCGCGSKFL